MIEVDPRTRSTIWGLVVIILGAAGWPMASSATEITLFLAIMVVLSIVLGATAAFFRGILSRLHLASDGDVTEPPVFVAWQLVSVIRQRRASPSSAQ